MHQNSRDESQPSRPRKNASIRDLVAEETARLSSQAQDDGGDTTDSDLAAAQPKPDGSLANSHSDAAQFVAASDLSPAESRTLDPQAKDTVSSEPLYEETTFIQAANASDGISGEQQPRTTSNSPEPETFGYEGSSRSRYRDESTRGTAAW